MGKHKAVQPAFWSISYGLAGQRKRCVFTMFIFIPPQPAFTMPPDPDKFLLLFFSIKDTRHLIVRFRPGQPRLGYYCRLNTDPDNMELRNACVASRGVSRRQRIVCQAQWSVF